MYCGSLFVCQPSGTIRDTPRDSVAGVVVTAVVWKKGTEARESDTPRSLVQSARQVWGTLPRHQTFWLAVSSE
jgi:hypothetical protein